MRNFRKLEVWSEAHDLTLQMDVATQRLPTEEKYGLCSQLRRACVSVASNIAEGAGRRTDPDFAHLLDQASGSATEVECQILICRDLGFFPTALADELDQQVNTVKRLLAGFTRKIAFHLINRQ